MIALAGCAHLAEFQARLLHGSIEPALLAQAARVTVRHLDQLAGRYERHPSFPYLLAYLASHPSATPEVRAVARAGRAGQFPLADDAAARLLQDTSCVLIVLDRDELADDERATDDVSLLLQSLLAGNPALQVTLLAARPLRSEHLRVRVVPADDRAAVAQVFSERYDALVAFTGAGAADSPVAPGDSSGGGLMQRVQEYAQTRRPLIFARSGLHAGQLVYARLDLDGRPYAEVLGLDRRRVDRPHDGTFRLLAHLGLPIPLGEHTPILVQTTRPSTAPAVSAWPLPERVLILTPLKDATPFLEGYVRRLLHLTYPHQAISLGFLESDSTDGTCQAVERLLPELQQAFRRAGLWKRDFGYQLPEGVHRGAAPIQIERRSVLARGRNHLLSHALDDEAWVLWLDVDVVRYPDDLIEQLLAAGKEIVQPHCVLKPGGPTFDTNGWRDRGRLHLDDLRTEGQLVELDAVGGTVLLVCADLHRDGLVFPTFLYGRESPWMRPGRGEIETEGPGIMARDMGYRAWGLPHLEVIHARH